MGLLEADSVFGKALFPVLLLGAVLVGAVRQGVLPKDWNVVLLLAGLVVVMAVLFVADTIAAPTPGKLLFFGAVGLGIATVFVDAVPILPGLGLAFAMLVLARFQRIREVFFG